MVAVSIVICRQIHSLLGRELAYLCTKIACVLRELAYYESLRTRELVY